MKYPGAARVTRRQDIEHIRKAGRTLRTSALVVRWSPSRFSKMRVGVVVPRFGESAVDRNRLKRRLREHVRSRLLPLGITLDIVLWAQPSAYRLTFDALGAALQRVIDRMDLVSTTRE
ncbi:MAG: ribonuclease P protein component [Gemmatimonadaceae bacterium]|nr:ribonuclease P protein component [Gemmatimonadaceae bacterium]